MQTFFYDEQIRRFLLQFARIFSNFQIEYLGKVKKGNYPIYTYQQLYNENYKQTKSTYWINTLKSLDPLKLSVPK